MSFLHHLPPVSQGQFRLKDLVYPVACASLSAHYENMELVVFPSVDAKTEDKDVEYEMRSVYLYHNNGFNTHCSAFEELIGKKFIWTEEYNDDEEEAGTLCVQEHEEVQKGTIEFLELKDETMLVRWSGEAVVGWNRKYGSHVPFDTIFSVEIPQKLSYVLDGAKSSEMKIDTDTTLKILNLEEFNRELEKMPSSGFWGDSVLELDFILIDKENHYNGNVIFDKAKNNHLTILEEGCPRDVNFRGLDYNLRVNYEMFHFGIARKATDLS